MSSSDNFVKNVLILAANPKGTAQLRLDEEVREIDMGLQRSRKRDQFILKQQWAVRPRDVHRAILDFRPQIVHFCGHGAENGGLALENETGKIQLVNVQALASLFELFAAQVECVLLNACYSEVQANAISQHIDYVIGMNQQIGDQAAINFAVGFYDAVGAGESYDFAYKLGCRAMQMAGTSEQLTPLIKKN
ncbi:MAG: CHAT domain-containing protein [Symploca sp. SIO2E6]|nr:CHAT domain-containing protein [Symploca sp. SIO2E6]